VERSSQHTPGRLTDRHRPAHVAATRRRPGSLRAGRPLLRWPLRAHLRRPLPGRCRWDGDRGHHRTARGTACRKLR
jgi:hypothetical protein